MYLSVSWLPFRDDNLFIVEEVSPLLEKSISVSMSRWKEMFLFPCGVFALLLLYIPFVQVKSHLIQKAFSIPLIFTGSSCRWPSDAIEPWAHRPAGQSGHSAKQGFFISLFCFPRVGELFSGTGVWLLPIHSPADPQLVKGKRKSSGKYFLAVLP